MSGALCEEVSGFEVGEGRNGWVGGVGVDQVWGFVRGKVVH